MDSGLSATRRDRHHPYARDANNGTGGGGGGVVGHSNANRRSGGRNRRSGGGGESTVVAPTLAGAFPFAGIDPAAAAAAVAAGAIPNVLSLPLVPPVLGISPLSFPGAGAPLAYADSISNAEGVQSSTESDPHALKVSGTSNPKSVAGYISHTARSGTLPPVHAAGPGSLNQAIKAIAIARTFMADDRIDLLVYPELRGERTAVRLVLHKLKNQSSTDEPNRPLESDELKVSQNSKAPIVAGSIAGKVRSNQRVSVVAIGPSPVAITVCAIAIARQYLAKDRFDVSFRPDFVHVDLNNETRSAIRFTVLPQAI